jgi:hypothetical protein
MQNLEKEVLRLKQVAVPGSPSDAEFDVTPRLMTLEQVSSQLDSWLQLTPKKRTPKKKPPEPPA